jgi:hypothetical protein
VRSGERFPSCAALTIARRRVAPDAPEDTPLRHVEIPFGPYLVAAAIIYLFLQQQISVGIRALYGV